MGVGEHGRNPGLPCSIELSIHARGREKFGFVFYKLIEPLISSQLHVLDGLGNSKN